MFAPYTAFGITKLVEVVIYRNGYLVNAESWDKEYWIERPEDWYGLGSVNWKGLNIRVIEREQWLNAKLYNGVE